MCLEMIKSFVSGNVFNEAEMSVTPTLRQSQPTLDFDQDAREIGLDWTYAGDTMTGWERLDNACDLLKDVIDKKVNGVYFETRV